MVDTGILLNYTESFFPNKNDIMKRLFCYFMYSDISNRLHFTTSYLLRNLAFSPNT